MNAGKRNRKTHSTSQVNYKHDRSKKKSEADAQGGSMVAQNSLNTSKVGDRIGKVVRALLTKV